MKKIILAVLILFVSTSIGVSASFLDEQIIQSIVKIESSNDYGDELFGSGFLISSDSFILTSAHIIIDYSTGEPYEFIKICTISDEYSSPICKYSGKVLAFDEDYDLALLVPDYHLSNNLPTNRKVDISALNLPYLDLSDSLPRIGERLVILGFPDASQLSGVTLTEGIVSGFYIDFDGYIREMATDATINPGNSGGPALNNSGKATGVVVAISTMGIGGNYGYVITSEILEKWFNELAEEGLLNTDFVRYVFSNDGYLEIDEKGVFIDVSPTHKYALAINFLKNKGIIDGYPDGFFRPDREINRAELLKILVLARGHKPSDAYRDCFPDVETEWFSPYVCFAKANNWIQGYEDGNFRPGRSVSKAESLKMIFNVFNIDTAISGQAVFEDVRLGTWYIDYVYSADFLNILDDVGRYYFPNTPILRGQVSEYIYRAITI